VAALEPGRYAGRAHGGDRRRARIRAAAGPGHVGANHDYIHAVEASPHPERALPSAERLKTLVHMPAHIYMRTGDYEAAARANAEAARVDEAYIKADGVQGIYPLIYYNHNLDFLSAAASMAGRYADVKRASQRAAANAARAVKDMPMAEFLVARPLSETVRDRRERSMTCALGWQITRERFA
jgi:hypothetical protein